MASIGRAEIDERLEVAGAGFLPLSGDDGGSAWDEEDEEVTSSAAEPEEDHDDPARDGRNRKREPDAEQPDGPRPPGGERHTEQRQRGARNLRPQRIPRPGERAFQNDLEGLFNSQNKCPGKDATSIPATFLRVTVTA